MKRPRGTQPGNLKIKKVKLKNKHARAVRKTHILSLIVFVLLGFGVILAAFTYIYNQYQTQQVQNTVSREQLDYGAITPDPIDTITLGVLSGVMVLAIVGTAVTIGVIINHNGKHHIYRVASGHSIPVPHHKEPLKHSAFAVGQTEESRKQAQVAVQQHIDVKDESKPETSSSTKHIAIQ